MKQRPSREHQHNATVRGTRVKHRDVNVTIGLSVAARGSVSYKSRLKGDAHEWSPYEASLSLRGKRHSLEAHSVARGQTLESSRWQKRHLLRLASASAQWPEPVTLIETGNPFELHRLTTNQEREQSAIQQMGKCSQTTYYLTTGAMRTHA